MKLFFRTMSCISIVVIGFVALATLPRAEALERPPQFVMLAFDGSSSIGMWQATRNFAREATRLRKPVKFTYFISAVYYVGKDQRGSYSAAGHSSGSSAIGWGGDAADLTARYDQTNFVHQEGHEIASHAVGHWDGSAWTPQDWTAEFQHFNRFFDDFFSINSLKPTAQFPSGWIFSKIVGFRAPLLGVSPGLWPVLKDFGYRYDTSRVSGSSYWPEKLSSGNHWNFPLASLRIAGTGKKTLSMDYNFYVADSNAQPDSANKDRYKRQMFDTYMQYFESNYNGNRAPIHIGHHFSTWNGGAYWEAMKEFALQVCGRPEVRCGTYRELADFMDSLTPEQRQAYQSGNFDRAGAPTLTLAGITQNQPGFELDIVMQKEFASARYERNRGLVDEVLRVELEGSGRENAVGGRLDVFANGARMPIDNGVVSMDRIRAQAVEGQVLVTASVKRRGDIEIARSTRKLLNAGTANEELSAIDEEARALKGDLPEAHADEPRD